MAAVRPLVLYSGQLKEMQAGDVLLAGLSLVVDETITADLTPAVNSESQIGSEKISLGVAANSFINIRKSALNQWHAHPNDMMFDTTGRTQMGDPQAFGDKTYVEAWDLASPEPRIRLNTIGKVYIGDTEGAVNSTQFIVDDVNQRFIFDTNNALTPGNIVFPGIGAGVIIGETTGDLFAFWGAAATSQPSIGSHAAASFTANSGTAVNDASTFDGYTLKQVVGALRAIGLLA